MDASGADVVGADVGDKVGGEVMEASGADVVGADVGDKVGGEVMDAFSSDAVGDIVGDVVGDEVGDKVVGGVVEAFCANVVGVMEHFRNMSTSFRSVRTLFNENVLTHVQITNSRKSGGNAYPTLLGPGESSKAFVMVEDFFYVRKN